MKECGHLQIYTLHLKTVGPLFIGAGRKYSKVDYTLNRYATTMYILDECKLSRLLVERDLVDMYESYIIGTPTQQLNMYYFLTRLCGLKQSEIDPLIRYSAATGDQTEGGRAVEIDQFVKDARGEVYIPGSSVKGALRTALLTDMILTQPTPSERRREWPHGLMGRALDRDMDAAAQQIESDYLHTLQFNDRQHRLRREDAVNSLLRGVMIADSAPLPPKYLTLGRKIDVAPDGYPSKPNLIRECIQPEQTVDMTLTLDQSVLKGRVTGESLIKTLKKWTAFYSEVYLSHFKALPQNAVPVQYAGRAGLLLGGGGGYFSKTITYPYYRNADEEYPYAEALDYVCRLLSGKFPKIPRERDENAGIAPAMVKYVETNGRAYPMGWCEVSLS